MKKMMWLAVALPFVLFACKSSGNKAQIEDSNVIAVDQLLEVADNLVDQTIHIKGHVTHTCKHSGKRAFLVGDNEQFTVRIEAGGEITGFDRNLVGSTLVVNGVLKERRLSEEYINQWEEELKHKAEEDGSAESCATEMSNIKDMRDWMKEHGKNHYSIYYLEGLKYEVVE